MTVDVLNAAHLVFRERYPDAEVAFAAGSLVRGEGTAYSDLYLVVVFPTLPAAYRESFRFQGLPVEVFVHDPETLEYFFVEMDVASGIPTLPWMVMEASVGLPSFRGPPAVCCHQTVDRDDGTALILCSLLPS